VEYCCFNGKAFPLFDFTVNFQYGRHALSYVLVQVTVNAPLVRVKLLQAINENLDSYSYLCLCECSLSHFVIPGRIFPPISPLSSNRQHSEINDCLEDNREDYYVQKQLLLSARLSHCNFVRLSVCPSICPSHGWISQKRCKLELPNLYHQLPGRL